MKDWQTILTSSDKYVSVETRDAFDGLQYRIHTQQNGTHTTRRCDDFSDATERYDAIVADRKIQSRPA